VTPRSVAVLGAGNGGCAAAADLARRCDDIRLYNRSAATIEPIIERGGIQLTGALGEAFVPLETVTTDLAAACDGADLVMLCVPTSAHDFFVDALAEVLAPGQPVFLNPGHVGGGLYLATEIHRRTGRADIPFGETTTLTYGSRMSGPAAVNVMFTPTDVAFAAFPGRAQSELFALCSSLYPTLVEAENVLETALLCINSVEHPAQVICNAGWVEATGGDFRFYHDGTSPSVGRVIDRLDEERLAIAAALGMQTKSFVAYFHELGYTSERAVQTGSGFVALQDSEPNRWIKGPRSLDGRYIHEDIGRGLVPWVEIGRIHGVDTPLMDALIALASEMNGIDYRTDGLTLDRMGLAARPPDSWDRFLQEGIATS
jgi:opine dehydrogenase